MRRSISGVAWARVSTISLLALLSSAAYAQAPAAAASAPSAAPLQAAPGSPMAPVAPAQPQPVPPAPAVAPPPPAAQPVLPQPPPAQPVPAQPVPAQPVPAQPVQSQPVPPPGEQTPQPVPAQPVPPPVAQPVPPPAAPQPASQQPAFVGSATVQPPIGNIELQPPPLEPAPVAEEAAWYTKLNASAFVDGYFSWNANIPRPQDRNRFRAYDYANGFGLAWAGLDLGIDRDSVGGTLNLRFGPSAARLAGATDTSLGLQYVKQAFATWRPGGKNSKVTLDLGKFDTIFGAELADSQLNFNYTRGLLYWLAQPAYHTGLRANFSIVDEFWITALVANGWNNSLDNNVGKTFGVQFNAAVPGPSADAAPVFDAHIGYLVGPEGQDWGEHPTFCSGGQGFDPNIGCVSPEPGEPSYPPFRRRDAGDANTALKHLIDVVLSTHPTPDVAITLNADLGFEQTRDPAVLFAPVTDLPGFDSQSWWGVSLAGRYQFHREWAGALRLEVLGDPDARTSVGDDPYIQGVQDLLLTSATLTGEYAPDEALLLRLDARVDGANEDVFPGAIRAYTAAQFTTTLGVVVSTN